MGKHHLVLGSMQDILSGETIEDNHDNRYRQKLAARLLEAGYKRQEIRSNIPLILKCDEKRARIHLDFLVKPHGKAALLVRYGPGSIVTRRTPGRAAALLMDAALLLATNGEDAELLETRTGTLLSLGLDKIPPPDSLPPAHTCEQPLTPDMQERCHRILYAFEVNDACPCDDAVCHLDTEEQ
ncbi:hypothetical protein LZ24_02945 [Desulfobotulus alkaliphilus]|uniref:Type I restriction and modification enzyme subunit R-like protein n=1 Tax=Desulfobotulus alkaliphilus TaxID=622671 RepID=A0A562RBU9_9BACT|nr:adenosine deaminase [Desulfobotulus alkaliphilus]TWI66034.1 hypothetical protein LZ24_02945 [Desulfobotulus alkaliphilus]